MKLLRDFDMCDLLCRLDVESKIPETLQLSYISCRPEEKVAALLCLLNHVVTKDGTTIIFVATKHHVEYLSLVSYCAELKNNNFYSL